MFTGGDQGPAMMPYPGERRWKPRVEMAPSCPRCDSPNTKFCYYNNYSLTQPRYFCKGCRRYWTKGGSLRNVPVGGGCRKNRKGKPSPASASAAAASPPTPPRNPPSEADANASSSIDLAELYDKFMTQTLEEEVEVDVDPEFGFVPDAFGLGLVASSPSSSSNYDHHHMLPSTTGEMVSMHMHELDFTYGNGMGVEVQLQSLQVEVQQPLACPMEGVTGDNFSMSPASMFFNGDDDTAAHQYALASGDWSSVFDQASLNTLY